MTANSTASPGINGAGGGPMPTAWNPAAFAEECRYIVETMRGHEAHRELDFLSNRVLSSLGFGEGVAIFEAAVAHWHSEAQPYPYPPACPDCERPKAYNWSRMVAARAKAARLRQLLGEGVAFKDAAAEVGVSERTARKYRRAG